MVSGSNAVHLQAHIPQSGGFPVDHGAFFPDNLICNPIGAFLSAFSFLQIRFVHINFSL